MKNRGPGKGGAVASLSGNRAWFLESQQIDILGPEVLLREWTFDVCTIAIRAVLAASQQKLMPPGPKLRVIPPPLTSTLPPPLSMAVDAARRRQPATSSSKKYGAERARPRRGNEEPGRREGEAGCREGEKIKGPGALLGLERRRNRKLSLVSRR